MEDKIQIYCNEVTKKAEIILNAGSTLEAAIKAVSAFEYLYPQYKCLIDLSKIRLINENSRFHS